MRWHGTPRILQASPTNSTPKRLLAMTKKEFLKALFGLGVASALPTLALAAHYDRIYLLDVFVAGAQHHHGIAMLHRLQHGTALELLREPHNPFDANAIAVCAFGQKLGYVPARKNKVLARLMDAHLLELHAELHTTNAAAATWEALHIHIFVLKARSTAQLPAHLVPLTLAAAPVYRSVMGVPIANASTPAPAMPERTAAQTPAEPTPATHPWLYAPNHFAGGVVRPFMLADGPAFAQYRALPEVAKYQGYAPMSEEVAFAFVAMQLGQPLGRRGQWVQWAIATPATDDAPSTVVGDIGLHLSEDGSTLELGISLAPSQQGTGMAYGALEAVLLRACQVHPITMLELYTDARNTPAIQLAQRFGFVQAGQQQAFYKGEWVDELHFIRHVSPNGSLLPSDTVIIS